jgi:hypothetical protein
MVVILQRLVIDVSNLVITEVVSCIELYCDRGACIVNLEEVEGDHWIRLVRPTGRIPQLHRMRKHRDKYFYLRICRSSIKNKNK